MIDPELQEVLGSFKQAIDLVLLKIENLEQRASISEKAVTDLEQKFITDIYEPAQKAFDEAVDAENFRQFSDKYGERLKPYAEPLRSIEGDDFDITRKAYDEFNALENKDVTSDEYVDQLVLSIENQLNLIREKLGAKEVEVQVDEDGSTKVKADGETVDKTLVTQTAVAEDLDKVPEEKVVEFAEEVLDSPEEIAKFERELAASLNK